MSEKPAGSGTCFRTASAFVLKDASIGQIVTEMRYNYPTNSCSQGPTTDYVAYHYDHIGNVVALSDCDGYGTMREGFDMEAFGNLHQGSQNGVRLTTKEYDPDAGLYYFGARWYDPELGKWMEKEPTDADGPNMYHYVFSNPVNDIDINGKSSVFGRGPIDEIKDKINKSGCSTGSKPGPKPCNCANPAKGIPIPGIKCIVTPSTCSSGSPGVPCPCVAFCYFKGLAFAHVKLDYMGTCP